VIVSLVLYIAAIFWGGAPHYASWGVVLVGLVISMYLAWLDQYKARLRAEARIEEIFTPVMKFVFEAQGAFVQKTVADRSDGSKSEGILYRVGLRNIGRATIHDARVQLVKMEPSSWSFLPLDLHFMHDNPAPNAPYRGTFPIDRGETRHVDVVEWNPDSSILRILHTVLGVQNHVEKRDYVLTLRAHGTDVEPSEGKVAITVDASGTPSMSLIG
jgi:hypothetical protein